MYYDDTLNDIDYELALLDETDELQQIVDDYEDETVDDVFTRWYSDRLYNSMRGPLDILNDLLAHARSLPPKRH